MAADLYPSIFERPGEHADEVETSLGLAYFPDLMKPELADDGAARPTRFEAINRGWVSITRPWHLVSDEHGAGRPAGGDGGEGPAADGGAGGAAGAIPGRAGGGGDGRAVPVLRAGRR